LQRNLKTSNTNIKSQAYLSLVRPDLEYACSVEHCNKDHIARQFHLVETKCNNVKKIFMLNNIKMDTFSNFLYKCKVFSLLSIIYSTTESVVNLFAKSPFSFSHCRL
jgi:hypothetical protein